MLLRRLVGAATPADMALIIEDGTGKADAQSVATAEELRGYALLRGISVPSNDAEGTAKIEAALLDAMDYLSIKPCFQGEPFLATQSLPFPRKNVYIRDVKQIDAFMPAAFKTAQIRLALAVLSGVVLMPNISGRSADYVVKEKVGPLEVEYANPTQFNGTTTFTAVDLLLAPLLGGECCETGFLKVFRA